MTYLSPYSPVLNQIAAEVFCGVVVYHFHRHVLLALSSVPVAPMFHIVHAVVFSWCQHQEPRPLRDKEGVPRVHKGRPVIIVDAHLLAENYLEQNGKTKRNYAPKQNKFAVSLDA